MDGDSHLLRNYLYMLINCKGGEEGIGIRPLALQCLEWLEKNPPQFVLENSTSDETSISSLLPDESKFDLLLGTP